MFYEFDVEFVPVFISDSWIGSTYVCFSFVPIFNVCFVICPVLPVKSN